MYLHITYSALEACKNLESSYSEICVKCNKCGRFDKEYEFLRRKFRRNIY